LNAAVIDRVIKVEYVATLTGQTFGT